MAKDVLSDSYYFFHRDGLSHDLDICPSFETLVSFRTVSKWICSYHKLRHYNFCTMVTVWACHYLYYWCLYEVLARCENHCPNKICSKVLHPIKCYGKKKWMWVFFWHFVCNQGRAEASYLPHKVTSAGFFSKTSYPFLKITIHLQ